MAASLLAASAAQAQSARQERACEERSPVAEKLSLQRAALALLQSQRVGVLEVLELVEKLSRGAESRVRALQAQVQQLETQVEVAREQEVAARAARDAQYRVLAPRLAALYRLSRQNPLHTLLSTRDLNALTRRARALGRMLKGDLELLQQTQRAASLQEGAYRELATLQGALSRRLSQLRGQAELARRQRQDLLDLFELVRAEASQSHRLVRELEQAEHEMTRRVLERAEASDPSGFAQLRGRLPFPVEGRIEVGFGKVINPRFQTTVLHKGLDLRAPRGTPVRAIAPGKVVYAGWLRGYGNLAIVDQGSGFHTLMAHLDELFTKVGDRVVEGQVLGTLGDTGSLKGAYLYFELRRGAEAIDPSPWFGAGRWR